MSRYDRQRKVGAAGQSADDRLAALRVLLVGVGGIGAPIAIALVRAGVGSLNLVDPDVVSETDLPRQPLYFPEDVLAGRPKVAAALRELERIGGRSRLEGSAIALTPRNAHELVGDADLVIDATDHLPAREWIDAACRELGVPWVHTAAVGEEYRVIPFLSPGPPCFRCYLPESPPAAVVGTCESTGVLPVATELAAQHAIAAIWRWLRGEAGSPDGTRTILRGRVGAAAPRTSTLVRDPACPGCGEGASGSPGAALRLLCGKRRAEGWVRLDAAEVKSRLCGWRSRGGENPADSPSGGAPLPEWRIEEDARGLRAERGDEVLTLSLEGRLLYGPTDELERARARLLEVLGPDALS